MAILVAIAVRDGGGDGAASERDRRSTRSRRARVAGRCMSTTTVRFRRQRRGLHRRRRVHVDRRARAQPLVVAVAAPGPRRRAGRDSPAAARRVARKRSVRARPAACSRRRISPRPGRCRTIAPTPICCMSRARSSRSTSRGAWRSSRRSRSGSSGCRSPSSFTAEFTSSSAARSRAATITKSPPAASRPSCTPHRATGCSRAAACAGSPYSVRLGVGGSVGYITEANVEIAFRTNAPWWESSAAAADYSGHPQIDGPPLSIGDHPRVQLEAGAKLHARVYNAFLEGQFRHSDVTFGSSGLEPVLVDVWLAATTVLANGLSVSYAVHRQTAEIETGRGGARFHLGEHRHSRQRF